MIAKLLDCLTHFPANLRWCGRGSRRRLESRLIFALVTVCALSAACSQEGAAPEPPQERISTFDIATTEQIMLRDQVQTWRTCAENTTESGGTVAARRDLAAGEWRFMTYKHYEIGVYTEVPGIVECSPKNVAGQDRFARKSQCGEVRGLGSETDCQCQVAELSYLSAYNRQIIRARPDARARNCDPSATK